jgi:hypothetical protein
MNAVVTGLLFAEIENQGFWHTAAVGARFT